MLVERSDIVKRMRELGFLYRDIGDVFEVSRQRAHHLATSNPPVIRAVVKVESVMEKKSPVARPSYYSTHRDERLAYYRNNRERILERAKIRYAMKKQEVE